MLYASTALLTLLLAAVVGMAFTLCLCPLLLASEWRHRWWSRRAGSGSVSWAWAAGTSRGRSSAMSRRAWAAAVQMPWGGVLLHGAGSAGLWQICREGLDFGGLGLGRAGAACLSLWGGLAQGMGLRGPGEGLAVGGRASVLRKQHRTEGQAHTSPAPTPGKLGEPVRTWVAPGRSGGISVSCEAEGLGRSPGRPRLQGDFPGQRAVGVGGAGAGILA